MGKKIQRLIIFIFLVHPGRVSAQSDMGAIRFTDERDGKAYKGIMIGEQVWMAENLDYITKTGSWLYREEDGNEICYGRLYDWKTSQQVCPSGWHLPSDEEWKELEGFLGMSREQQDQKGWRGLKEGSIMKSRFGWKSGGNGADEMGFSALPCGFRDFNGAFGSKGVFGYFWTSTEGPQKGIAWSRILYYPTDRIGRNSYRKSFGLSVRCIKDRE